MKIEAFGFQPALGKEYVVTFAQDGELLHTIHYNGADLPQLTFTDNAKVNLSITDKETGKLVMSSEYISYNGKLYTSTFNLPLKEEGNNMNANVYISDLHYDLTTGSVLVQIQGFAGDQYTLVVSDKEFSNKVMEMPITLEEDMHYSIPTELVQGALFEVSLKDQFGKHVDVQEFIAPISTDWRYTEDVGETSELVLDQPLDGTDETLVEDLDYSEDELYTEGSEQVAFNPTEIQGDMEEGAWYQNLTQNPLILGGIGLALLLIVALIAMKLKKGKKSKGQTQDDDDDEFEEYPEGDDEDGEDDPDLDPEDEDEEETVLRRRPGKR